MQLLFSTVQRSSIAVQQCVTASWTEKTMPANLNTPYLSSFTTPSLLCSQCRLTWNIHLDISKPIDHKYISCLIADNPQDEKTSAPFYQNSLLSATLKFVKVLGFSRYTCITFFDLMWGQRLYHFLPQWTQITQIPLYILKLYSRPFRKATYNTEDASRNAVNLIHCHQG